MDDGDIANDTPHFTGEGSEEVFVDDEVQPTPLATPLATIAVTIAAARPWIRPECLED
jgi:hypothetical protein